MTFKTVFLLALGSGKRRSEIHAWQNKNIRHQSDWSKASLYSSSSFLSKNLMAKEGPDSVAPVVIPLSPSSLIGLYAQSEYCTTIWTGPQTLGRTRSWYLSHLRKVLTDISPATISSWIKETVIPHFTSG